MEKKVILICTIAGLLGLLSAATGLGAEATRIKGSEVEFTSLTQCKYPRTPAMALGLTSALALVAAHVIISIGTGCVCCKKHPSNSTIIFCFMCSWFTFIVAFFLLLTGAALNDEHGEESTYFGNHYCYVVKPGVFAGGSVLSLASVILGISYYLAITKATNANNTLWGNAPAPRQGGIAMGQPQIPSQPSVDPVFVHEDTYMRRQFT